MYDNLSELVENCPDIQISNSINASVQLAIIQNFLCQGHDRVEHISTTKRCVSSSPVVSALRRMKEMDPPPYGTQYRQDIFWEGMNVSSPIVAALIDHPGRLIANNTYYRLITSWKKPIPGSPPGSLTPECITEGHSKFIQGLACFDTSCNILSASGDGSICQWTIDGVQWGVLGLIYLVGAAADYSIRIWDLRTDQPVGDPLLHDDILTHVVMSHDGTYIIGAGLDVKIYTYRDDDGHPVRSIEAQLSMPYSFAYPSRQILHASQVFKQQRVNRGLAICGKDFWDTNTDTEPRPAAPTSPSSSLR
ncbi:hypothetical protein BDR06DRAFT_1050559 [Suillus hirtellus]|nr:hypothetical protein BDR06DRAFT_1050559 [Suillus hirtellus]